MGIVWQPSQRSPILLDPRHTCGAHGLGLCRKSHEPLDAKVNPRIYLTHDPIVFVPENSILVLIVALPVGAGRTRAGWFTSTTLSQEQYQGLESAIQRQNVDRTSRSIGSAYLTWCPAWLMQLLTVCPRNAPIGLQSTNTVRGVRYKHMSLGLQGPAGIPTLIALVIVRICLLVSRPHHLPVKRTSVASPLKP